MIQKLFHIIEMKVQHILVAIYYKTFSICMNVNAHNMRVGSFIV